MGQPVAGFLPLKTPRTTPPDDESMFDVSMFVERQQSLGRSVGMILTWLALLVAALSLIAWSIL